MTYAWALDLFVAVTGNDSQSGTLSKPFATLARARDEIRKLKKGGPLKEAVTVHVRGGAYQMHQSFKLFKEDSGNVSAPIVYRAYQNEHAALIGGHAIVGFETYQGKILKAKVENLKLRDISFRQLIFNGRRQHLARYPNFNAKNPYGGGWTYADGKYIDTYQEIPGEDKRTFIYSPTDERSWAKPGEVEVFVFPRYNWMNNICGIRSIDRTMRKVTLAQDASYAIRPGDRYYFRNAFEELDSPGEWYLDRDTSTLYFWPPSALEDKPILVPTAQTVIELFPGTAHVMFRGFTIEGTVRNAVVLNDTSDCRIVGCTIRNVGEYFGSGVVVQGGMRNGVIGCDIYEIGRDAIFINGGDQKTLTSAENFAENNYIHHTGVYYKQGVGINLNGVGNRAAYNLIHDCPRMAILFSGNNHLIEYNHIRHVNLETSDTGALYTGGRDWLGSRGTIIRYNFIHDSLGYGFENGKWVSPHNAWGIYLDDNAGGVDVIGNIVAHTDSGLIHLHNARDNRIENNIFVGGRLQQIECNGWTKWHPEWTSKLQEMIKGYESVAYQTAWATMRNMNIHPYKAVLPDGKIMSGNAFLRNIIVGMDPMAQYVYVANFPFESNEWDNNIVWNAGKPPVLTGQSQVGGERTGNNLVENGGFEQGQVGAMPEGWKMFGRQIPFIAGNAELVPEGGGGGKNALRMDAPLIKLKEIVKIPSIVSNEFELPQGRNFKLSARMKSSQPFVKVNLMLQSYLKGVYFWGSSPNEVKVGTEWKEYEFYFKSPALGEKGWHEKMKKFQVRVDFHGGQGFLLLDDITLKEMEMLDEWSAWQAKGMDRNSIVADPLFYDLANDDFRLRPESPAWALGFQPIPINKIGLYGSELRATWPVVEAEGVREKPLISGQ
jgi:hypothetical protein